MKNLTYLILLLLVSCGEKATIDNDFLCNNTKVDILWNVVVGQNILHSDQAELVDLFDSTPDDPIYLAKGICLKLFQFDKGVYYTVETNCNGRVTSIYRSYL